jgi:hypothetical protein
LCIAFKTANRLGNLIEQGFPMMPKRRVTNIMRQASGIDNIGIRPQSSSQIAPHLGNFKRMSQSCADKIIMTSAQHLSFGSETSQ